MVSVYNNTDDLINMMIKINSSWIKISDEKLNKLPISCKYFLTLFDSQNDIEINNFFSYIADETRTQNYPFVKDNQIDYSMMLEPAQFYNIELNNNITIKDISNNIDNFINIVSESNGKIVFVLDICFLLNFMVQMKNELKPNHLIDMIIYKLTNISKITNSNITNVSEIFILDRPNIIPNTKNLFYLQLEKCLNIINDIGDNEKYIVVYKNTEESILENVYWNVLDPCVKISEHIGKIKSPFDDDSYFNLVKINNNTHFLKKISISECIEKNLFDLNNNPGIIIEPIDRLNI
jgi:hypothetical protein